LVWHFFDSGQIEGTFGSNERIEMTEYYFRSTRSPAPDYFVHVHRPLSLNDELPAEVGAEYRLLRETFVQGRHTID
jgi:hypothetical protein